MMARRLLLPGPLVVRFALWLMLFATEALLLSPIPGSLAAISFSAEVLGRTTVVALPPRSVETLGRTERVLRYLETAEKKELDPWLRDDLRIAWITTLYASRGNLQGHTDATYRVVGCHPNQVWARIVERRKAALGASYALWGFDLPPKKPARSVTFQEFEQRENAA